MKILWRQAIGLPQNTHLKPDQKRQINFDLLRVIAAFCIIFLHIDYSAASMAALSSYATSLLRWCVPIFFLLSGYFLKGETLCEAISFSRISRILKITITISLIYLPFYVLKVPKGLSILAFSGVWFHLWFLNSLTASLVFLKLYDRYAGNKTVLWLVSMAILLGFAIHDFQVANHNDSIPMSLLAARFLQGIPLIFIGYNLKQRGFSLSRGASALCVSIGIALCLAEVALLFRLGAGDVSPQFPLGALPMAFGLFFLFRSWRIQSAEPKWAPSDLGTYSLQIYLLHPFILTTLKQVILGLSVSDRGIFLAQLAAGVGLSLLIPLLIISFCPALNNSLNGNWKSIRIFRSNIAG